MQESRSTLSSPLRRAVKTTASVGNLKHMLWSAVVRAGLDITEPPVSRCEKSLPNCAKTYKSAQATFLKTLNKSMRTQKFGLGGCTAVSLPAFQSSRPSYDASTEVSGLSFAFKGLCSTRLLLFRRHRFGWRS